MLLRADSVNCSVSFTGISRQLEKLEFCWDCNETETKLWHVGKSLELAKVSAYGEGEKTRSNLFLPYVSSDPHSKTHSSF